MIFFLLGAEGKEIVIDYSNEKPGILANISFPLTQLPSSKEGLVVNHIQVTSWVFYALILCFVIQKQKTILGTFLVVHWLRLCLPMQAM